MPPILSCLVAKRICESPNENHWSVREFAGKLLGKICRDYGNSYETLQPRVTRTLLRAFLDPLRSLTTHYGAITGLTFLGPSVIKMILIPNMDAYWNTLKSEMEKSIGNTMKLFEAQKCRHVLLVGENLTRWSNCFLVS